MKKLVFVFLFALCTLYAEPMEKPGPCLLQQELACKVYDMRFKEKIDEKTAWRRVQTMKRNKVIRAQTVVMIIYHMTPHRYLCDEDNKAAMCAGVYAACKGHTTRRYRGCDDIFRPSHRRRLLRCRKNYRPRRCR